MKTLLLAFLFIAFFNASAQRNGISLEPIVGYGDGNNFIADGESDDIGKDAIRIGCGVIYMFNDHFGISSGLQYTSITSSTGAGSFTGNFDSSYSYNGTIEYTFSYIELPLLFRYISSKDNKIGFFAETGFNIGYLISSSETGTITQDYSFFSFIPVSPYITTTSSEESETVNSKNFGASVFNLSAHLALGVFIPLSEKCSLVIDGEINYGLTNDGNGSSDAIIFNVNGVPRYYYSNYLTSNSNFGTNLSALACARLNIKLGGNAGTNQPK